MTIQLHSLIIQFGEGNGTPLQYSCLENPFNLTGKPRGCRLWGRTESDTTEVT